MKKFQNLYLSKDIEHPEFHKIQSPVDVDIPNATRIDGKIQEEWTKI